MTEEEAAQTVDEEPADEESPADGDATGDETPDEDVLGPETTSLVARVAVEDESLAADVEDRLVALESERRELDEEVDDLEARLRRNRADFKNYKKRAKKRQKQLEKRATEDLIERLIDVRDNLRRAVEDEHEDVESLREGVELTLRELDRVFEDENVSQIHPESGEEVDPQRHEVMLRVESDHPEDTIADVYQPGYEMADKVLQAAQVTVSDGSGDDE
ncbi:GrpE protein [Haladaptatus paucihalophilus DX253]|uniref:Protein GrpE n=1 Tax=Haladaptatus paucihalophilus DX253 TaxID=797209 RepID=E7QRI1_HALPU|nr:MULTISPECIES: nucleotide exchange factor GrpE [Haladaptatus]EFW92600.1 GrpE protein [Haladaptatus paucihalophilus DX253]GKZ13799.1 nucleotide exchange factor GrpE [Haladaptatus sp. T7]SHK17979.1 molecular chaperone GrpE [Haladaptatus paucihalophilus DX253]